ncbi:hypothetical protein AOQ84DRAFT_71825 [Glonium stellatum]|uniref:Uncharacterized protein n=1 Tax=Glonium stellatum TaxID=574774 RepID=A0A8E2EYK6_9PEZI|nr:hypothetical protein AOQ84DRAFT_71825 [Glonium stellatum]
MVTFLLFKNTFIFSSVKLMGKRCRLRQVRTPHSLVVFVMAIIYKMAPSFVFLLYSCDETAEGVVVTDAITPMPLFSLLCSLGDSLLLPIAIVYTFAQLPKPFASV